MALTASRSEFLPSGNAAAPSRVDVQPRGPVSEYLCKVLPMPRGVGNSMMSDLRGPMRHRVGNTGTSGSAAEESLGSSSPSPGSANPLPGSSSPLPESTRPAQESTNPLQDLVRSALADTADVVEDDDIQLSLFLLYALHYGSLPGLHVSWEWDPELLTARAFLEQAFEAELRQTITAQDAPQAKRKEVAAWLFERTKPSKVPGLAHFVAKSATQDQLKEFVIQRSIYTLREADPHSWAIPRLSGRAKAALVEIQADEYGGGDPTRMHAVIFAQTMRGLGLDDTYPAYINDVPAITLASQNMMSMFGINRRLLGAIVGHLAAFEMTSSIPNRLYGDGFRRHGFGKEVTWYFDEHVEADAVHEQIAGHDLAGALAEDEPDLLPDILFGASACLAVDERASEYILAAWKAGRSSLRSAANVPSSSAQG